MHTTDTLQKALDRVERLARTSIRGRLAARPWRYLSALGYRKLVHPMFRAGWKVRTSTFFGARMQLLLPAATDVYLTGGKTHDSEIRLSRFLINRLKPGDTFVDVGAHFGFFTLLASHLTGPAGRVWAFEAAPRNFQILETNTQGKSNIGIRQAVVSDKAGDVDFFEFPTLYSEYNTTQTGQFEQARWFRKNKPVLHRISGLRLDDWWKENRAHPVMVKIDVEGSEYNVIRGMEEWLRTPGPLTIVMEYLGPARDNADHRKAFVLLLAHGFAAFALDAGGHPVPIDDPDSYLAAAGADSDNLAFIRT